jgi:hypothetical protein
VVRPSLNAHPLELWRLSPEKYSVLANNQGIPEGNIWFSPFYVSQTLHTGYVRLTLHIYRNYNPLGFDVKNNDKI